MRCLRTRKSGSYLEGGSIPRGATSTQASGNLKIDLALTLLETRVLLVDNVEFAVTTDDFAINATFLHRGFYFHDLEEKRKNYLYRYLIRPFDKS